VRELIEEFYEQFLGKVAAARGMTPDAVDAIAQGRVWTGEQAVENGLVDELGGFPRALEMVKEKASIPASEAVQLVEFPRPKRLFELLLERTQRGELRARVAAGLRGQLALPSPLEHWLAEWHQLEALAARPLWALLPTNFAFR
jgi:protease-4